MSGNGRSLSLASLKGTTVKTSNPERFPEPGIAPIELHFSDGSRMRTDYWRIICDGNARVTSFDHQQKYGLPAPIDAFAQIGEGHRVKILDRAGGAWKALAPAVASR